ncbi:MAG: accessory gene regulator B family protein [Bacillota bacterium]
MNINLTRSVAGYLKDKLNLTQEQEEIALYGLQFIVYQVTGFFFTLLVGWLLGCFWTTLAVDFAASSLRMFSGGAHSKTPLTCFITGVITIPLLGKLAAITAPYLTPLGMSLIVTLGFIPSTLVVYRLAPVDSPANPITSVTRRRRLRFLSLLVLMSVTAGEFLLLVNGVALPIVLAASLGVWWQTFTLTRSGHRFATIIDNLRERGERV